MVVGEDGSLPLPWLAAPLSAALASQRGHALLLHASPGVGALAFSLVLAQSWLCEAQPSGAPPQPACGRCASCRQIQSRLHPDLQVLLPETLRREEGWPLIDDKLDGEDSKRKPSKQIRIDEARALVDWICKTSGRGRGKVVLLHPAEALNLHAANALLKTLEEPPAGTRLLLTASDPATLLPTVRSRCQLLQLPAPEPALAASWLTAQGVAGAEVLLAACSGRPLDVLAFTRAGMDAATWCGLPEAVARGQVTALAGWPVPLALDALHKVCHDTMAISVGAQPRFFPADRLPRAASMRALAAWQRELARVARHDDHPWNEGLLLDALVAAGASALARRGAGSAGGSPASSGQRSLDTLSS